MRRVVIIGAGVQGREIAEILHHQSQLRGDVEALGYVDDNLNLKGTIIDGLPVLGGWEWFEGIDRGEFSVICGSGFSEIRRNLVNRAKAIGLAFTNAISPVSYVSPNAALGEGIVISQNGVSARGTMIGDHSIINLGAIVSHDTQLGAFSTLNPGVSLAGNVSVGEGCYLGIGCSVVQQVSIGEWTIVGAGAAVISDLPENVTAVGVPARVIKRREKGWHEQLTSVAGS